MRIRSSGTPRHYLLFNTIWYFCNGAQSSRKPHVLIMIKNNLNIFFQDNPIVSFKAAEEMITISCWLLCVRDKFTNSMKLLNCDIILSDNSRRVHRVHVDWELTLWIQIDSIIYFPNFLSIPPFKFLLLLPHQIRSSLSFFRRPGIEYQLIGSALKPCVIDMTNLTRRRNTCVFCAYCRYLIGPVIFLRSRFVYVKWSRIHDFFRIKWFRS